MPQPKKSAQQDEQDPTVQELTEETTGETTPETTPDSTFDVAALTDASTTAGRQIARALELETEKSSLLERIAANRDYLRLMDKNDELTPEQGEFLDAFYPVKEKGERRTKDEIEATKRAKDLAATFAS